MTRTEVTKLIAPVVRAFTEQAIDLVEREVGRISKQAMDAVLVSFRQGGERVAARGVVAPSVTTASAKVTRTRAPRSVARAGSSPAPDTTPTKKPRKCGACGYYGHRADRCPNAKLPPRIVIPDEVVEEKLGSPPPVAKNDRFARIEAAAKARRGNG